MGCCVTVDGAVTGEVTSNNVDGDNYCIDESGCNVCGVGEASNNKTIRQHGDSGGPVYEHLVNSNYDNVDANGIIIAINDSGDN